LKMKFIETIGWLTMIHEKENWSWWVQSCLQKKKKKEELVVEWNETKTKEKKMMCVCVHVLNMLE